MSPAHVPVFYPRNTGNAPDKTPVHAPATCHIAGIFPTTTRIQAFAAEKGRHSACKLILSVDIYRVARICHNHSHTAVIFQILAKFIIHFLRYSRNLMVRSGELVWLTMKTADMEPIWIFGCESPFDNNIHVQYLYGTVFRHQASAHVVLPPSHLHGRG